MLSLASLHANIFIFYFILFCLLQCFQGALNCKSRSCMCREASSFNSISSFVYFTELDDTLGETSYEASLGETIL